MFNKEIYVTTLTSEAADKLFSNITASNVPDNSFTATLRAVLRNRLPQDKSVRLSVISKTYYIDELETASVSACVNWVIPDEIKNSVGSEYNIFVIYTSNSDAGAKMLDIVRANAGTGKRYMSGYTLREDLRAFYARKLNAFFYTDNNQNTVIFMDKLELKHFHILQMMIPKYFPHLFLDKPLTEAETSLLKSTGNKTAVEYENLIEEFAKEIDIRAEIIRTKLLGFETVFERIRMDEIKNEIVSHQSDYDYYLSLVREASNNIQEKKYTLAGLECSITEKSGDSEIMEYFMCNKNLSVMRVSGTIIEFVSYGYADVYDENAFEQYVKNHGGFMYKNLSPAVTIKQMETLYRSIFSQYIYKLRLCAAYTADMRNGLKPIKHYNFPPESRTYLPNTHIQHFGCIGSYASRFQEYMKKKDYVGVIDQAVVSGRNLNFYDSAVIATFANALSCSNVKCIERLDGTLLTPIEAINELEGCTVCQDQL